MSGDELVRIDSSPAWLVPNARLPRPLFAQAMRLLAAAQSRAVEPDTVAAYWMALSDVDPIDFPRGVQLALKHEKFMTPAVVAQWCDEARDVRIARERQEHEREQLRAAAEARAERERERERHTTELERDRAGWTAAPETAAELLRRMLVSLELDGGSRSLRWSLAQAKAEWTGEVLAVTLSSSAFVGRRQWVDLSALAGRLAGREVRVADARNLASEGGIEAFR